MIYTETEYKRAVKQLADSETYWANQRKKLAGDGLTAFEIDNVLGPSLSIVEDLKNDIEWYEQAKKGKFSPLTNIGYVGKLLIALRIYRGLTQEEFARKLSISHKQVSSDEYNEYHGISVDRVAAILRALNAKLECTLVWRGRKVA